MTEVADTGPVAGPGTDGRVGAALARRHLPASELEARLGAAHDPANPAGFGGMVARDAAGARPVGLADVAGGPLRRVFAPRTGRERLDLDQALLVVRVAARRDVTVMPATMFNITAVTQVLLAGRPDQRDRVLAVTEAGGSLGFAGLEEDAPDLFSTRCHLGRGGSGHLLDGGKWLVGLANDLDGLVVLCHDGGRGPTAFSLVLLDEESARAARCPADSRASGFRGVSFGRFRFTGLPVRADQLVGRQGEGMEITLRSLQVVRLVSLAAGLAGGDTALRLAWQHASGGARRGLRDGPDAVTTHDLAVAVTALVAADLVSVIAVRAAQAVPGWAATGAALAKRLVGELTSEVVGRCSDVLGMRGLLTDGPLRAFDVVRRDLAVARYVDTAPLDLVRELGTRLDAAHRTPGADRRADPGLMSRVCALDGHLPPFELAGFTLASPRPDPLVPALLAAAPSIRACLAGLGQQGRDALAAFTALLTELGLDGRGAAPDAGHESTVSRVDRHCALWAGAAAVLTWWGNRELPLFGLSPGAVDWLVPVLDLVLGCARGGRFRLRSRSVDQALVVGRALLDGDRLVSAVALPLAGAVAAERGSGGARFAAPVPQR
ncbi:acyl-CoA dehydrogenase family protein [Actinoalloteichus spitiensis]|uniref:acyl-CoA dehydrogenase family protein n=1 Tax=Actinoalloteichus spitiensis TaxID=252394 RepID=UPI0003624D26|nr:acyl-CoA dehydrogenase family protein [Actinoalloteichus spitiensis]